MTKSTKKIIIISLLITCLIGLFQAGILRAILLFILMGAVPGTSLILSPNTMTGIIIALYIFIAMTGLGALMPHLVKFYRRYILRKKLLTIPAFRRLIRTHQA